MRIAVCGSHRVGKTTLAEALAEALPGHELVPEPYALMEEEGYEFGEMPSIDDFEAMLDRSIALLGAGDVDVVFDRRPLDMLSYLTTHRDAALFDRDEWMPRIREAISTLDLIVLVPIEDRDGLDLPRSEARLRAEVDTVLLDIVPDIAAESGVDVLNVSGVTSARVKQVSVHLNRTHA